MAKKPAPSKKSADSEGLSLGFADFLSFFRERWWIGLIFGVVAAALIVVLEPKKTPIYRTEVSLLFEPKKDRVLPVADVVDTTIRNAEELNNQLEQIRSNTFFDFVMSSFSASEIARIREPYRDPENPDAELPSAESIIAPNVSVHARRGTTIIGIVANHRSPEAAALIANRYAQRYIAFNLDRANTGTNNAIVILRQQADERRADVEAANRMLLDYRTEHNIASLGEYQNVIKEKVAKLGSALVQTQMEQTEHQSILDEIEQYQKAGRDLTGIPQILAYGSVSQLRAEIDRLNAERVLLAQTYLRRHPKMLQNQLQLDEAQRQLDRNIELAVSQVKGNAAIAATHETHLRQQMKIAEENARNLDKVSSEYALLEKETAAKNATYLSIVDRLNDATISSQAQSVNVKIFDPAPVPRAPANLGPAETALKAGAAGIVLLLGIPIGLGLLDSRVKSANQIERGLKEPLLGIVKRIKRLGEAERAHAFRLQKDESLSESYRGIYSEIELRTKHTGPKTILITSSVPGEGKSTTASNLAAVFAAHDRRTLLIDCDLRRPTLGRYFGLPRSAGWLQWLSAAGDHTTRPLPETYPVLDRFDILPAGGSVRQSSELLNRLTQSSLLTRLRDRYDVIILDTPPVAVFPDALLLAQQADELIYVCRFEAVRLSRVRQSIARLREAPSHFLGLVLNQVPEKRVQQYGYYGYGSEDTSYYREYSSEETPGRAVTA